MHPYFSMQSCETILHTFFCDFLLSLYSRLLRIIKMMYVTPVHTFHCHLYSSHEYATIYLPILLLIDICIVSSFWLLPTVPLSTLLFTAKGTYSMRESLSMMPGSGIAGYGVWWFQTGFQNDCMVYSLTSRKWEFC